uniref:Uncharacterized protein n=1 Tax=Oryza brachyantha TaxID=4533 RepID=J3L7X5_ORYBR
CCSSAHQAATQRNGSGPSLIWASLALISTYILARFAILTPTTKAAISLVKSEHRIY